MSAERYRETLPAAWYYEPEQYRRELQSIWYRQWICLGRAEDWAEPGDFHRLRIGDQQILVTRAEDGALHAMHNSCRHRGSIVCTEDSGRFERGRIVCPYHAWTYALNGQLLRAPRATAGSGLRVEDFPLYRVALATWRGFVFVNLSADPEMALDQALAQEAAKVAKWPVEELRRVHRVRHRLACNWKIFWENYLECYHCPSVHPDLCRLVPVYSTGYESYAAAGREPDPARPLSMLRPGAVTWSNDGTTRLPWFEGLGENERAAGMTFADFMPTLFLVAHVDYVRTVQVLPAGPEQTDLTVDWYVHRDVLDHPELDVSALVGFGDNLVREDARVCELNQQGLRCNRRDHGVLLDLEEPVYEFNQWVRRALGEPVDGAG
jgi:Rieske 2Fe-2S family protein